MKTDCPDCGLVNSFEPTPEGSDVRCSGCRADYRSPCVVLWPRDDPYHYPAWPLAGAIVMALLLGLFLLVTAQAGRSPGPLEILLGIFLPAGFLTIHLTGAARRPAR